MTRGLLRKSIISLAVAALFGVVPANAQLIPEFDLENSERRATPVDSAQIAEVAPSNGTPDADTDVSILGSSLSPDARISLLDGGPFLEGRWNLTGNSDAYGAALDGQTLLVAYFDNTEKLGGLRLVDVSNPEDPQLAGSFITVDIGSSVACSNDVAYVLTLNPYTFVPGMRIVDASDPQNPLELGNWFSNGFPRALEVVGDVAYLALGWGGLALVDVSDPANPAEILTIDTQGDAADLVAADDILYVANGGDGLKIYDTTAPMNPVLLSTVPAAAFISGLEYDADGRTLFVADPGGGVAVIDVANPSDPQTVTSIETAGDPSRLFLDDSTLYIADGSNGLEIYDVSDRMSPLRLGGYSESGSGAFGWDVFVEDGLAYVTNFFAGFNIVNVESPATPALLASAVTSAPARGVDQADGGAYAYVSLGLAGFATYDVTDPLAPQQLALTDTLGTATRVSQWNDLAGVADGSRGAAFFDVSNPVQPIERGRFDTRGTTTEVEIDGDVAFVADGRRGLVILDVSDPDSPQELGKFDTRGDALAVEVDGDFAYVADKSRGVVVLDISNLSAPFQAGTLDTAGRANDVLLDGTTLFVADDFGGLRVMDVSTPATPQLVQSLITPGSAKRLSWAGSRMLIADESGGLVVVDVDDLQRPTIVGAHDTPGSAYAAIALDERHALVADDQSGLQVVGMNPPVVDLVPVSSAQIDVVIPAGHTPGPYDVVYTDAAGDEARLRNGFLVCGAGAALEADLIPLIDPNSMTVSLPISWRLDFEDASAIPEDVEVMLNLPPFEQVDVVTIPGETTSIELRTTLDPTRLQVVILAQDVDAMLAIWNEAAARGGFLVPRLDADSFGELTLALIDSGRRGIFDPTSSPRVMNRDRSNFDRRGMSTGRSGAMEWAEMPVAAGSTIARYDFDGTTLTGAWVYGSDSDFVFELSGSSKGCRASSELLFSDEVQQRCEDVFGGTSPLNSLCDLDGTSRGRRQGGVR